MSILRPIVTPRTYLVSGSILLFLIFLPLIRVYAAEEGRILGERDKELLSKVDRAVKAGAKYLLGNQHERGFWSELGDKKSLEGQFVQGITGLCILAVLRSGAGSRNPQILAGMKYLREKWASWVRSKMPLPPKPDSWYVFDIGCTMLALEAFNLAGRRDAIGLRKKLHVPVQAPKRVRMPARDFKWMSQMAQFLIENRAPAGDEDLGTAVFDIREKCGWSFTKEKHADRWNTLFAILGLSAASRCGVKVGIPIFKRAVENCIAFQEEKGKWEVQRYRAEEIQRSGKVRFIPLAGMKDKARGWAFLCGKPARLGFTDDEIPTGCMTVASLSVILCGMEEVRKQKRLKGDFLERSSKAARDGLAWLDARFTLLGNPGNGKKRLFFYLWGIERVCDQLGLKNIGRRDWYGLGAQMLTMTQRKNSSWSISDSDEGTLMPTCFVLLFLVRKTLSLSISLGRE